MTTTAPYIWICPAADAARWKGKVARLMQDHAYREWQKETANKRAIAAGATHWEIRLGDEGGKILAKGKVTPCASWP